MKMNWLSDSRLNEEEVKKILKDPHHPKFDFYGEKLLSRVSDARIVFDWMEEGVFCQKWPWIKKRMKKDQWLKERVIFWQTIYDRLLEKWQEQGIRIRKTLEEKVPPERARLAQQIRAIRTRMRLTQRQMAEKLGVIQQYISKIERGHENVSVDTLRRIAQALGKRVVIQLR